jgi:hypothetical protein
MGREYRMKPYLVSSCTHDRLAQIANVDQPRIAIYNRFQVDPELGGMFDRTYKLQDLYKDETFFDALATVTGTVNLYLIDLGMDYCSTQPDYIKEYTKLKPLSQQAAAVCIMDHFAFYFTEKAIYRPFLYINADVIGSSVQEFYGTGIYREFEGNRVENYAGTIAPYVDMRTQTIPIHVVSYTPTPGEVADYEALKRRLIIEERKSKQTVLNGLFSYISTLDSKREAITSCDLRGIKVCDNNPRRKYDTYKTIIERNAGDPVVFFSSGTFGVDEMALDNTMSALRRHNDLIEALRG